MLLVLDLDRTVCRFPATTRLYKRLCLQPMSLAPALWGLTMLFLMHVLWFFSPAVRLQRRIVMSLLSRVEPARFQQALEALVEEVVEDWRLGLGADLAPLLEQAEAVYIVSHCPQPLGEAVAARLGFQGARTVPVRDYLGGASGDVYDKVQALGELKAAHPGLRVVAYADDLVDLGLLNAADEGTLVNGSWFSRSVCRLAFPGIRIVA